MNTPEQDLVIEKSVREIIVATLLLRNITGDTKDLTLSVRVEVLQALLRRINYEKSAGGFEVLQRKYEAAIENLRREVTTEHKYRANAERESTAWGQHLETATHQNKLLLAEIGHVKADAGREIEALREKIRSLKPKPKKTTRKTR